jgi:hypothetical protein
MSKEVKKAYYEKNKEKLIAYQVERYNNLSEIYGRWKKTLSCSICGENDPACLEFHHCNPAEKEQIIRKMIGRGINSVLKELKKCVVVCANCHSKIHAYNQETTPDVTLSDDFKKFHDNVVLKQHSDCQNFWF